jgi:hypothetical protein
MFLRLFIYFLLLISSSKAQEINDLIRNLSPDFKPPTKNAEDPNQIRILSETQKKLLLKVMDELSDREVDDYLFKMGLSTNGSIYAKKIRLRDALGLTENKQKNSNQVDSLNLLEPKKQKAPYVIENASEGEFVSVDKTKNGVLILKGRVKIRLGEEGVLEANTISVDTKRNEIYAEGGIKFKDGLAEIEGDKFIYDFDNERGVVYDSKASFQPITFQGKKIKKIDESKYLLEFAYFSSCNAEVPHYTFKAKKLFVYQDKSIIATNLWFNVGGSDLLYLPLYYGSSMGSGWVVQAGQNRTQGKFLQTAYQWSEPTAIPSLMSPIGRKIKIDYYEKVGEHLGFEFWKVSPWLNYNLDLGVANYKNYQFVGRYTDLSRFTVGGLDQVVVTNQVDRGERCIQTSNGRCIVTYSDLIRAGTGLNVRVPDIGPRNETWWKGNLVLNARKNFPGADGTRNLQVNYQQYTNPRFDYEFGYRYEPVNTLQSLYTRRTQRNPFIRQNLQWNMDFTETRGDLTVSIGVRRISTYYLLAPANRADFFPVRDELPRVVIKNSSQIAEIPYFNSPLYIDFSLNSLISRIFGAPIQKPLIGSPAPPNAVTVDPWGRFRENLLRTEYFNRAEVGLRTTLNFGSYVAYSPGLYVGGNKQSVDRADTVSQQTTSDLSLDRYYKRESYYYVRNNHSLSFGIPLIMFTTTYRHTGARNRELDEPILKDGRDAVHEAELMVESNSIEDFEISIRTIRDLRRFSEVYNPQPSNQERWYFTILRMGTYYDFYDGFQKKRKSLLEKQRTFFAGVFLNNDYVHHTVQNRPLYNNATAGFQMGGFTMPFIRNIRSLEIGASWYHVFNSSYIQQFGSYAPNSAVGIGSYYLNTSPFLDSIRYYIQTDIQFNKVWGLVLELDSRLTQPWRYTNQVGDRAFYISGQDPYTITSNYGASTYQPVNPVRDLGNSTGLYGSNAQQNSAVNIYRFMGILKHNLHDFEYNWGYSMDLRSIVGGPSFDSMVNFYDQSIFFSVNLINISLGDDSASSTQTRARIYRYRKNPLDAGYRSNVSSD